MESKIFIIIPIYNVCHYLDQCLKSVLNQTYKFFELILVDDGSTDGSSIICDEYAKTDGRITVIHKPNNGVSSARNAGLDYLFRNKYEGFLTFIDADDWIDNDYLENLTRMLKNRDVDIVCSSFKYVNGNKTKSFQHIEKEKVMSNLMATNLLVRDETIQSHSYSKLFKLKLWNNIRYNTCLFYMEDQEVICKVFYKAKNVYVTNYAGYYYRQDNVNAATKTKINNKKVISGLKGYYYPCLYEGFTQEDRNYLLPSIHNALINAYLMLIPYYKNSLASNEEKEFIKELKKYIRDNKLIKQYKPAGKNNSIKKKLYKICPPIYPYLFRFAKLIK